MPLFKLRGKQAEPPIPENEKEFYRPDSYYTEYAHPGTAFARKVVTFDERKKISFPSKRGLYVAEILLLEYVSYGKYPNPKSGYPGLWWFECGIRNVGAKLESLKDRGFIEMGESGKYRLTELGQTELSENAYVPYMHKAKDKTTENAQFGPVFNVWEINRRLAKSPAADWQEIVAQVRDERSKYSSDHSRRDAEITEELVQIDPAFVKLQRELDAQDAQLLEIRKAEETYAKDHDINALISFWEGLWAGGGLLFRSSTWNFRLPDLYIQEKRYSDALRILKKIPSTDYADRKDSYIKKVKKLSATGK